MKKSGSPLLGASDAEDIRYVAQIVGQRIGLSQQDAVKRVAGVYAKARAKVRDAQVAARGNA